VGPFSIRESKTLEEIESSPFSCIIHPEKIVSHYDVITLSDDNLLALKQGKRISNNCLKCKENCSDNYFRIYDFNQRFWGIVNADFLQGQLIPYKMMEKPI
jgi:tRNA U55 pseudouridine synthase TruB